MAKVVASIGKLFGVKEPKPDTGLQMMQQREDADTRKRAAELNAEKAALASVAGSGRLGRARLAFQPSRAPAAATPGATAATLG